MTTHNKENPLCLDAKQEAIGALIRQHLGHNIGCNADWSVSAWHLYIDGQDRYLLDMENDTYSVVTRAYDEDNDVITTLETFHVDRLAEWLKAYSSNLFISELMSALSEDTCRHGIEIHAPCNECEND